MSCCAPSGGRGPVPAGAGAPIETAASPVSTEGMTRVAAGSFLMGSVHPSAYPDDGEGPVREVTLDSFRIDTRAVTNADFARFVEGTGYRTEAQRYGWSFVFAGLLPDNFPPTRGVAAAPWWRQVEGADWSRPEGPGSTVELRPDHPVVHISWADADAYARWVGKRLPTEAEWECAARAGHQGKLFPWGDELEPGGQHRMNVWQGSFPAHNSTADGWYGTCPVDTFEPNDFGLYNMTGNVWEWCADQFGGDGTRRVAKGGSYLCHSSYCRRYRVAARQGMTPDSTTGNVGFRCVAADTGPERDRH